MWNKEEPPITGTEKLKIFLSVHWRGVVCLFTPLLSIPILLPFPPENWQLTAYCLVIMAMYWVTECIPLPVTSFLPVIIFPLAGISNSADVCRAYFNDTLFMFIGNLILASAIEQSGLHRRLAYCMIRIIGYTHVRLLASIAITTTFISLWITNTAATSMMVPVIFAVLKVFEDEKLLTIYETNSAGEKEASDISACYFCLATFSATIGGLGTLVGTVTNLAFKGLFMTAYPKEPEYLSFPMYSAFALPLTIVAEILTYLCMIIQYCGVFRPNSEAYKKANITPEAIEALKKVVNANWVKLGKLSFWEFMVCILFGGAMVGFFCRSPQIFSGWGDQIINYYNITSDKKFVLDSSLAAIVSFLMLLLPSNFQFFTNFTAKHYEDLPKKGIATVLDWKTTIVGMPYSFSFLLGGGFALSEAAKKTGLNEKIGEFLQGLKSLPNPVIVLIIVVFVTFITNFASNVAVANVVVPIAMQLASQMNRNQLLYCLAAGLAASYCFMIPVGTPGNLIVQSAAKVSTRKMIKAGFFPSITTILVTWALLIVYAPMLWDFDKSYTP